MPYIKTSYRNDFYFGASRELINLAKEFRKTQTVAEKLLWDALRNHGFSNFKFRRQHPVKWFIADFYCHEVRLIIEVDGGIHKEYFQAEHDQGRTSEIETLGIHVIRFSNEEILSDLETVLQSIQNFIQRSHNGTL
jgi:very-short-patch-repair endonuclease